MAGQRVSAPDLEQFVVSGVQLTGDILGTGAYGSVEEVEIPGARVAAKKLHTNLINLGSPQQVHKWVTDFVEECKLMSQLRHPHVVQFLGVCYLPGSSIPSLLMEKLQTSLDSLLETSPNIPLDIKVHLLTGTARGVVYLHSHTPPIAHRDLTARNILIDSGLTAKVADLGVAKMVNIQPGQLAATMTAGPGNGLYMPPESAAHNEGATRYNTAIDIFSFGVVSLFTLTQVFPKELKPATFYDPRTRKLVARSEIERREHYIKPMKASLGKTHPLVKLTLDCLEYLPKDRPSAVDVLGRLEEARRTVPQNCPETKLELIQRMSQLIFQKDEEIHQIREEKGTLQATNNHLQTTVHHLQAEHQRDLLERIHLQSTVNRLQTTVDHLQAEKLERIGGLEQLTTLQQQQLEVQHEEIERLSGQLRSLELQSQDVPSPSNGKTTLVSSSITFNWRSCKDRPGSIYVNDKPAVLDGKLYIRGWGAGAETVLEYTPELDQWAGLSPPPVMLFTVATLKGKLLVVGGKVKSTDQKVNTIFTFKERSQQWVQSHPALPTALTIPTVIGYQNHLIVAGGRNSKQGETPDVNILDTTSNQWKTAQPLPNAGYYNTVLIEDTVYLVGEDTRTVLRAHVPTLISGAKSGVWETLSNNPLYGSSPIAIDHTLLTAGGRDKPSWSGNRASSIYMYNPILANNQWTKVGDLPEPNSYSCAVMSQQLFIFGTNPCTVHKADFLY